MLPPDNNSTPSFDNSSLFYRLTVIEVKLTSLLEKLSESTTRLEDKIADLQREHAGDISEVKTRQDALEKRVHLVEKFRDNLTARVAAIASIIAVAWALFGQVISDKVKGVF